MLQQEQIGTPFKSLHLWEHTCFCGREENDSLRVWSFSRVLDGTLRQSTNEQILAPRLAPQYGNSHHRLLFGSGWMHTYLSKRSSASSVGFCWAFSGVGWEACSCSSRRRWISCRISLRWQEALLVSDSSFFPLDVFTPSVPPLPSVLRLLILQVGNGYLLNSFT